MPYTIKRQGSQYVKINRETGKVVSHHATMAKARASARAAMAGERGHRKGKY